MNKRIPLILIYFLIFIVNSLSQEKYDDLVKEYNLYYDLFDKFAYDIEITNDAEQMASIINLFVDKMEIQMEAILNCKTKYPELDTIKELPENLKNILIKINTFLKSERLAKVNKKTYDNKIKSERLKNALSRLEKLMKK